MYQRRLGTDVGRTARDLLATDVVKRDAVHAAAKSAAEQGMMTGADVEVIVPPGTLTKPSGLEVKDEHIYVTDTATSTFVVFDIVPPSGSISAHVLVIAHNFTKSADQCSIALIAFWLCLVPPSLFRFR